MKIRGWKISWDNIHSPNGWYFYWWNWLPKEYRYWGYECMWYDGPIGSYGLWFINLSWQTPWTKDRTKDK